MDGPSPRAWSLRLLNLSNTQTSRSIPTCVGFTANHHEHSSHKTVHPHVRGVYAFTPYFPFSSCGPSPRAWGLRKGGETEWNYFPVHPHVRGVYSRSFRRRAGNSRSIPTCVGFTNQGQSKVPEPAVHPHVRGVYKLVEAPSSAVYGPSPRAWGLRDSSMVKTYEDRSIPTCVGFTFFAAGEYGSETVHPHVRGVYISKYFFISRISGPSPRAWGLRPRVNRVLDIGRSIPTCVGFTEPGCQPILLGAVHPHVRGVYKNKEGTRGRIYGPSPRAWGLHD